MEKERTSIPSLEERKERILQVKQEGIITDKQAEALLAKAKGERLNSKNRTYIFFLKQVIGRAEKNYKRAEALKQLLLFLGISPEIGQKKKRIADKICFTCGTKTVFGIQHLYRKGKDYTIILEDIPVLDCPNCDEFYLDNDTLKLEDRLLAEIEQAVSRIQQLPLEKGNEKQRCPICEFKYLTKGETEVYRFKRHEFHLILQHVPVPIFCQQCGYEMLDSETNLAIAELMININNKIPALRMSGWRKQNNN